MILYDTYITQLEVEGVLWQGPNISATSWREAEKYCEKRGMGYLTVVGKLCFEFKMFEFN